MNLIVFTASYPFVVGGESNFLQTEMKYLANEFHRVMVVPEHLKHTESVDNVESDISFAEALSSKTKLHFIVLALASPIFYKGLKEKTFPRFSLTAWRRLIIFAGKAEVARRWVLNWLKKQNQQTAVFYTYWFDFAATGIAFAKKDFPNIKLVSRAHGYDIFEEQYYNPPFFPCRETTLSLMNRLFPDSAAGLLYLNARYPDFSSRYESALLGVSDSGFLTQPSKDGVFRIVSCSMIRPEKRVEALLHFIAHAARLRPDQKFEWFHFGEGATREHLQKTANETFPSNAKAYFLGYSTPENLMNFYKENPLDVFINVSITEGTPVSIMEAIRCGIPVIATAVGGNREIVSPHNGILLNPELNIDEFASAIFQFIDHAEEAESKRRSSRSVWENQYNADRNFSIFAEKLKSIASESEH